MWFEMETSLSGFCLKWGNWIERRFVTSEYTEDLITAKIKNMEK